MKKRAYFLVLSLLILCSFLVSAETLNTTEAKAYSCLESKVIGKCSTLSIEEKIFSLLAIDQCKSELLSEKSSDGCYPSNDCNIKNTAQSALALKLAGESTVDSEDWLLSKKISASNVEWFLQIDPIGKSSCTVSYSDRSYSIVIDEEKAINRNAGNCLTIYDDYWFKIAPSCYNQEFEISCNNSFLTSLIYRKKNSQSPDDFYVSDKINSASGEGITKEAVKSSCFSKKTTCDYEGTLWATLVLNYLGKDISEYIPYLVTMMEDNSKYLPESFLYPLIGEFEVDLLAKQKENKFWLESGDKFYDTAVALFPFQNENLLTEKTNSKNWLKEVQGNNGCWQDNIRNTAFLLYSLWAKKPQISITLPDCKTSGNFCLSSNSCSKVEGNILPNYSGCLGTSICCSKPEVVESCSEQEGELCESGEVCLGGVTLSSSDSTLNSICCAKGECGTEIISPTEENTCESMDGECKSYCLDSEQSSEYYCSSSNICCIKDNQETNFTWVLIVFGILIVTAVLGLIFKDRIRHILFKSKLKGKSSTSTTNNPRFPPSSSSNVYPGITPRRVIPYQQPRPRYTSQRKTEVDDVLKKLKDISK